MLIKTKKCPNCNSKYDEARPTCPVCGAHNSNPKARKLSPYVSLVPWKHQIILIFLGLLCLSLVWTLVSSILQAIKGAEFANSSEAYFFTTFSGYAIVVSIALFILLSNKKNILQLHNFKNAVIAGIAATAVMTFIGGLLTFLVANFTNLGFNNNQTMAVDMIFEYPFLSYILFGVFGSFLEEMTYRVGLFSFIKRVKPKLAYVVTILVFSLIHFNFGSFTDGTLITELVNLPSYIICGAILTYIYEKHGLFASVIAHSLYNIFAVSMTLAV